MSKRMPCYVALCAGLASIAFENSAQANNGIMFPGYSTETLGMGGAGAANPTSSQAAAINPAGMGLVGSRFDINALALSASVESTLYGRPYSDNPFAPVGLPSFTYRYSDKVTLGVSSYGLGIGLAYGEPLLGASTNTKISLMQFVVAPTVTYQLDEQNTIGVSLLLAGQRFNLRGFEGFGLANPGPAYSYGVGASIGWIGKVTDRFRLGAAYFSHIEMGKLDGFEGHLASKSDVDIPQQAVVGFAYDITPSTTLAVDYLWINWSGMRPVGNKFPGDGILGSRFGPGTGWQDQHIVRAGLSYDIDDKWTVRVGGSYGSKLFSSNQNMLGFVPPITMRVHVSAGVTYNIDSTSSISVAWNRALERKQIGTNLSSGVDLKAQVDVFGISYGLKF
jgi:long-chain fatty acid transport protein